MECPCWIEFDFSNYPMSSFEEIRASVWDINNPQHTIFHNQEGVAHIIEVSQGSHEITVIRGLQNSEYDDGVVSIPTGFQADSIYACTQRIECIGETLRYMPMAYRQFATITLTIKDENLAENVKDLRIIGDTNGINCRNMAPIKGVLEFLLPVSTEHIYHFRVPRQRIDSVLELNLVRLSGEVVNLPIGSWIIASGYDWYAADLEEIDILIDHSVSFTTVTISGWSDGTEYIMEF